MTIQSTTWSITALGQLNVAFLGYEAEFKERSALSCSAQCLKNPPCLSFSFQAATERCFIFKNRVSFGINMVRESGFTHYWKIYGKFVIPEPLKKKINVPISRRCLAARHSVKPNKTKPQEGTHSSCVLPKFSHARKKPPQP